MSVAITIVHSKTKQTMRSQFDHNFNTFEEVEKQLKDWGPLASNEWCYIAQLGEVKRKYKVNAEGVWERVLHPRGTKKKKQVEKTVTACEFWSEINGYWIGSAHTYSTLLDHIQNGKTVLHNHRVTFSDGSVEFYNKQQAAVRETPSESAEVKQSPKPINREFFFKETNEWLPGAWPYDSLLKFVAEGDTDSPHSYPYRVTFDDGSVTYFTRDKKGDPLVERKTLEQPVHTPVVPCSIDDFYSVPAKTTDPVPDGWYYDCCNLGDFDPSDRTTLRAWGRRPGASDSSLFEELDKVHTSCVLLKVRNGKIVCRIIARKES